MDTQDEIQEAPSVSPAEFIAFAVQSQNLAAEMDEGQLDQIAQEALEDYGMDKDSMSDWFEQMKRGLELASLVKEDKSYPFQNAANVNYPLVTSAALQFNARAYPAIVPADQVVKAMVWGDDQGGQKAARALRVSTFMSWQLTANVREWEEGTDDLLVLLPIVGEMFRKWWYDPAQERLRCRLIRPGKLIINNNVQDINDAPRCTEELPLYPVEIQNRINTGQFVEFEWNSDKDKQGEQAFIEQHTRLDLDEDGYPEPYVVTIHVETQTVVRIVADYGEDDVQFDTEVQETVAYEPAQDPLTGEVGLAPVPQQVEVPVGITSIRRGSYFVPFKFMPGINGGFHGTGLGLLLGDISETINSLINMLLDAGHYASLGGGWIGSDFRIKGGGQRFRPGEWKKSQATGTDIKNSIVPMTFPGPDATLFQLLGMLIEAGREIASVKDTMTGEAPRANQTATTTLALIEQGMMVFTAAYKRIFRSLRQEYGLVANLNAKTVTPEQYNALHDGQEPFDPAEDFGLSDMDITPVADPRSVTKMQQAAKAQMLFEWSQAGLINPQAALQRMAEAMSVEDWEELAPQPDPMQQAMGEMQMESARADIAEKRAKIELTLAQVEETRTQAVANIAKAENDADRTALEAKRDRLDAIFKALEEDRARLEGVLGRIGGMEDKSRNSRNAGGTGQVTGSAGGGLEIGFHGGSAGFGIGPEVPSQGSAMGGGLL
jgi:chaperonin GroES